MSAARIGNKRPMARGMPIRGFEGIEGQVRQVHSAFGRYAREYVRGPSGAIQWPVAIKVAHCQKVRRNAQALAEELALSRHMRLLSVAAGLYHDLGRFEQYRRFKTFRDQDSIDHGELSATILKQNRRRFLHMFDTDGQDAVIFAVRYHNRLEPPRSRNRDGELLLKICRDADKLDIWRVFDDLLSGRFKEGAETINHGMPMGEAISRQVLDAVLAGRLVDYRTINNQIDFALMRLSWIFDMNFAWTIRQVVERGYLKRIKNVIPSGPERDLIFRKVQEYIEMKEERKGAAES